MAKNNDEEKQAIEALRSQGIDPETYAKEQEESNERIERLGGRIQEIRGRVRGRHFQVAPSD